MLRAGLARVARPAKGLFRRVISDWVFVTTPDGRTLQGGLDQVDVLSAVASDRYESGTLSAFRASLRPGARVLDLGANIGVFATLAGLAVGGAGEVIAVEPDERNLRHLRANLRRLGLTNVDVIPSAIAGTTGTMRFAQAVTPTNSTLYSSILEDGRIAAVIEVPTITVDDLLGDRRVDVVKVDVQGSELACLDGMRTTLERNPDLVMFLEFEEMTLRATGSSPEAFIARLRTHFAQVLVIDEERKVLVQPEAWRLRDWQNVLCAPGSFIPNLPHAGGSH
jgi:FkbM family methyltransferase